MEQQRRREKEKKRDSRLYLMIVPLVLITFAVIYTMMRPELRVETTDCAAANVAPSEFNVQVYEKSDRVYDLEYAKTTTQQDLGLSRRPCLPQGTALLFLFAHDDKFGIWMKDMRFPIDVVWMNKDKKVVYIEKNMLPESYPKVYYPPEDARYVLEFNKGEVDAMQLNVGATLKW